MEATTKDFILPAPTLQVLKVTNFAVGEIVITRERYEQMDTAEGGNQSLSEMKCLLSAVALTINDCKKSVAFVGRDIYIWTLAGADLKNNLGE